MNYEVSMGQIQNSATYNVNTKKFKLVLGEAHTLPNITLKLMGFNEHPCSHAGITYKMVTLNILDNNNSNKQQAMAHGHGTIRTMKHKSQL